MSKSGKTNFYGVLMLFFSMHVISSLTERVHMTDEVTLLYCLITPEYFEGTRHMET